MRLRTLISLLLSVMVVHPHWIELLYLSMNGHIIGSVGAQHCSSLDQSVHLDTTTSYDMASSITSNLPVRLIRQTTADVCGFDYNTARQRMRSLMVVIDARTSRVGLKHS